MPSRSRRRETGTTTYEANNIPTTFARPDNKLTFNFDAVRTNIADRGREAVRRVKLEEDDHHTLARSSPWTTEATISRALRSPYQNQLLRLTFAIQFKKVDLVLEVTPNVPRMAGTS